ncbi:MAG: SGNH/GDSL hydrolase family protein [Rhodothermales bacterium]|nr:SGNH/GDSL hydrolase family protein [Rhodothermales bacterium]
MTLPDSTALRVLALGDSYTIGEAVPEAVRWPVVLSQRLRAEGVNATPPQIVARTGWTTDELDAAIDAANPQGPFDLVTLLIGVNNQYRGRSVDEYRGQFRGLLGRAVGFAGGNAGRVVVVSIPDWGVTPFGAQDRRGPEQIGREVDVFNAVAKAEAENVGTAFVDITEISRTVSRSELADDGLHPSGAQYARWAEAVRPVAYAILRP